MAIGRFHHGNLREALLDLAIAELQIRGFSELSLRELAQKLGVSAGAPYRHFSTKEDLLRAVAAEGHRRVLEAYRAAEALAADPAERLRTACKAYLALAIDNPGLFNLLFFTRMYAGRPGEPAHEGGSAFAVFERLIASGQGLDDPHSVRRAALSTWSLLHGFATLRAHGQLDHILPEADMQKAVLHAVSQICC
jgi:AcrR family transcriptional regulator